MLVEAVTCDRCGAPDTRSNPVELRDGQGVTAARHSSGTAGRLDDAHACESDEEVPF